MKYKFWYSLIICLFFFQEGKTQTYELEIKNSSFEGKTHYEKTNRYISDTLIGDWLHCSFQGETSPDIHSDNSSIYHVERHAAIGNQFLGMVVRENESFECVSQELSIDLKPGQEYLIGLFLAYSKDLLSGSTDGREVKYHIYYNNPISLRLYGGSDKCNEHELLFKTDAINHEDWKPYCIKFRPKEAVKYLKFCAYFDTPKLLAEPGNILLDGISAIYKIKSENGRKEKNELMSKLNLQLNKSQKIKKVNWKKRHLKELKKSKLALKKIEKANLDYMKKEYDVIGKKEVYAYRFLADFRKVLKENKTINAQIKVLNAEKSDYWLYWIINTFARNRCEIFFENSVILEKPDYKNTFFELKITHREFK